MTKPEPTTRAALAVPSNRSLGDVLQRVLLVGFVLMLGVGVILPWTPRVFWTVIMPLVPIGFVLLGFHAWRKVCPIATVGTFGAKFYRGRRRIPTRWKRLGLLVPLGVLFGSLVLRLVATNGDPAALGLFLGALGLGAFVLNARYGGRAFCHHACPVGVVERIYTDAAEAFRSDPARACAPCTGCTKGCADINRDRSYDRSILDRDRRIAFYAFPGVVFAFYFYYYLRAGTWEAYFDGRWTEVPFVTTEVTGPGFFFAPEVPAIVAAGLTILGCGLVSLTFFFAVEAMLSRRISDRRALRHRVLAIASFSAFNIFYMFAGAPTLRLVPGLSRVVAFVVPVVATIVLFRRLLRGDRNDRKPTKRALPVVSPG
ncbi:MAG: hypothetical protein AAGE52_06910 [Myxococcota bacterium]